MALAEVVARVDRGAVFVSLDGAGAGAGPEEVGTCRTGREDRDRLGTLNSRLTSDYYTTTHFY